MKLHHLFYYINTFDIIFTVIFFRAEVNPIIVNSGLFVFVLVKILAMYTWFLAFKFKEMGILHKQIFE